MAYTDLDSLHIPSAGQRPPASWGAAVNANFDYVYDNVLVDLGAWTSWTPTLTQSGAVTKTVTYAKYLKLGRTVLGQVALVAAGAGTANNAITVSMPFTAVNGSNMPAGAGYVFDSSAGTLYPAVLLNSTTAVWSFLPSSAAGSTVLGASGAPMSAALASGDTIQFSFHYEATS